jgi:2-(1,2-epoxy-1,2-dihydrophenyl)acetyl-CoA isomerase
VLAPTGEVRERWSTPRHREYDRDRAPARERPKEANVPEPVLYQSSGAVARIVLNRPDDANAIDALLARAFVAAVDAALGDASVRAILLTGAGRMFCGGGDIAAMSAAGGRLDVFLAGLIGSLNPAILRLATSPVPVVCAVNGPFAGGGIGLALCGDLVLAAESAKLRGGYTGIGLSPDVGASWFLTRRAGPARAKELLLTNRTLTARECLEWGIVNAVHPDDRLAEEADALARRLAEGATGALGRVKRLVDGAGGRSLEEHLAVERDGMIVSGRTEDAGEGVAAFLGKRPARFTGR